MSLDCPKTLCIELDETKNEVLDESVDDDELVTAEDTYTGGL